MLAASEARAAGYGGIAAVSRATGVAASTIGRGLKDLADPGALEVERIRRVGGGRKSLIATDASLLDDLLALVLPSERGDPMSPLRWTCKSLRRLAAELAERGHRISHTVVGELLKAEKFSLQANRKTREGDSHPDRDVSDAAVTSGGSWRFHDLFWSWMGSRRFRFSKMRALIRVVIRALVLAVLRFSCGRIDGVLGRQNRSVKSYRRALSPT